MSKKFSIIKTINIDKLDNEINKYILEQNDNFEPYIFMSENTASVIAQEIGVNIVDNVKPLKDGIKAVYCGYKVFIDNDLELGTVEIR